jgi:hypothetical protein
MIIKKLLSEQKFVCHINDTAEELAVIFSSCISKKKKKKCTSPALTAPENPYVRIRHKFTTHHAGALYKRKPHH